MNPIEVANHAAQQSDRWLLIAVVVILGSFAWGVIRYLVRREESRESRADMRAMEDMQTRVRLSVALEENNAILKSIKEIINGHDHSK